MSTVTDETTALLEKIFSNVNRWLDFAERKNAYVFSLFSFMAVLNVIQIKEDILPKNSVIVFLALYVTAVLLSLFAVFPKTKTSEKLLSLGRDKKLKETDNLIFYGDICKYSHGEFIEKLNAKYKTEIKKDNSLHSDLVAQILMNSYLAKKKYICFKLSAMLLAAAVSELAITILVATWGGK